MALAAPPKKPKKKAAKKLAKRKIKKAKRPARPSHPALRYIHDVKYKRIAVCKWVRLAVLRHEKDLKHGRARGLYFDRADAQYALDWFPLLQHSKGEWAGTPLILEDWEAFIMWTLFGWKKRADGSRRFRDAYISVARKNGKSTLAAGVGLYLFFADGEPGAEVYTAATKRDQAKIVHSESVRMVRASNLLKNRINIFVNNLSVPNTASKYEPLGADSDGTDGLNVHAAIADELHAWKSGDLLGKLSTARGSRREPMIFRITTAGHDTETVCGEQDDYTQKILEGIFEDDSWFGIIYTLDEKDDWKKEKNWKKANPNFGLSVKEDNFRDEFKQATALPRNRNDFLRYRLNVWTQTASVWIPTEKWDACLEPLREPSLIGAPCFGAVDVSSKIDLTALVLAFRVGITKKGAVAQITQAKKSGKVEKISLNLNYSVALVPFFWIPEDIMRERAEDDKVPYDVWADDGLITPTPGNIIDQDFIVDDIKKNIAPLFDIQKIAFDPWNATQFALRLNEEIAPQNDEFMIEHQQGFKSMSEPSKTLEALVLAKRIRHGGHKVLRWCVSNTAIKEDPAENIKPVKTGKKKRIDGTVAAIMSLSMMIREPYTPNSNYKKRGILVVG
tara:strand:- start:9836 stop:11689 length:1854 start_codon:yes stop_codon:yes gene_type:complete